MQVRVTQPLFLRSSRDPFVPQDIGEHAPRQAWTLRRNGRTAGGYRRQGATEGSREGKRSERSQTHRFSSRSRITRLSRTAARNPSRAPVQFRAALVVRSGREPGDTREAVLHASHVLSPASISLFSFYSQAVLFIPRARACGQPVQCTFTVYSRARARVCARPALRHGRQ